MSIFDWFDDEEKKEQPKQQPAMLPDPSADIVGPPVDQDTKRQRVKEYLTQKYSLASDDSEIKRAQADAERGSKVTNVMQALEGMVRARSQAYGGEGVDGNLYNSIRKGHSDKVSNVQDARKGRMDSFLTQNSLSRQAVDDGRSDQEFSQKKMGWEAANASKAREDDVGSEESQIAQALAGKMMPGRDFSKSSATQLKAALPSIEKMYAIEQKKHADAATRQAAGGDFQILPIELGEGKVGYVRVNKITGEEFPIDSNKGFAPQPHAVQKFKALPPENQEVIKDLSKKNASKISISNQIDAVMSNWDGLSDDQKVAQGGQLLKTLNSTEGADAIGVEEAKRLGAKLDFALGNLFNSNPVQFGRDLPGFKEQAVGTSKSIKDAVKNNEGEITKRYSEDKQPSKFPITVRKGNQVTTVENEQELKEVTADGWQ